MDDEPLIILATAQKLYDRKLYDSSTILINNLISFLDKTNGDDQLKIKSKILVADCLSKNEPKRAIVSLGF